MGWKFASRYTRIGCVAHGWWRRQQPLDYPRLPAGSLPSSPPRARANWPHRTLEPGIPQNPWRITRSNEAMNGSTSFEASDR